MNLKSEPFQKSTLCVLSPWQCTVRRLIKVNSQTDRISNLTHAKNRNKKSKDTRYVDAVRKKTFLICGVSTGETRSQYSTSSDKNSLQSRWLQSNQDTVHAIGQEYNSRNK
ncbi:unnamed protein product [Cuscuta europaea]|uniref:Uncharacterized protein n=1 Tax=Cuscuta europaea TaxID=41803 RepID=A0A9P0ZY13_CUSEU|nr:unnamed protein product [Cuscuta europaea]